MVGPSGSKVFAREYGHKVNMSHLLCYCQGDGGDSGPTGPPGPQVNSRTHACTHSPDVYHVFNILQLSVWSFSR